MQHGGEEEEGMEVCWTGPTCSTGHGAGTVCVPDWPGWAPCALGLAHRVGTVHVAHKSTQTQRQHPGPNDGAPWLDQAHRPYFLIPCYKEFRSINETIVFFILLA